MVGEPPSPEWTTQASIRRSWRLLSSDRESDCRMRRVSASGTARLIKGTPGMFIDFAYAPDAETAEKQVAEEYEISETLRDRLVAIREDL
jgi:hypothetical protein